MIWAIHASPEGVLFSVGPHQWAPSDRGIRGLPSDRKIQPMQPRLCPRLASADQDRHKLWPCEIKLWITWALTQVMKQPKSAATAAMKVETALRWQAENNEANTEQDKWSVEFKMCLLPVVFTGLTNTHVCAASAISPGHPPHRGQIIMQPTGSFMPGAGETACTTTFACYCFYLQFFFLFVSFYWACIMLQTLCLMVEPLNLLYPAWGSQSCSCSFNEIHPGKDQ